MSLQKTENWREIALAIQAESDFTRISKLVDELCNALDAERKDNRGVKQVERRSEGKCSREDCTPGRKI